MNLTEFSYYARKYGPLLGLLTIFLILLFYTLYLLSLATKKPEKEKVYTNPVFGRLELPKVPSTKLESKPAFELDTIEGVPITATASAKVYRLIQPRTKLTYLERSYLMAKKLGFDTTSASYQREGNVAKFKDSEKELSIDIATYNFSFSYLPSWLKENQKNFSLPENDLALQFAKEILSSLNKYPTALAQGKNKLSFVSINQDELKEKIVTSPSLANALRIDFYRKEEDLPIVGPKFPQSQNFAIVTVFQNELFLLKAQVKFFEVDKTKEGVYPLITGDEAWERFKNYKAFFVKLPDPMPDKIYIKKMFLAYYDPEEYTPYFQPFYVFLGKDFIAYVPAVKEEFLKP